MCGNVTATQHDLHKKILNILCYCTVYHKNIPDIFRSDSSRVCMSLDFNNFFAGMFLRKQAIERWYNFSPRPISVSVLPCKTANTEQHLFHLNIVCCFANKHKQHVLLKDEMLYAICSIVVDICRDSVPRYLTDSVH